MLLACLSPCNALNVDSEFGLFFAQLHIQNSPVSHTDQHLKYSKEIGVEYERRQELDVDDENVCLGFFFL